MSYPKYALTILMLLLGWTVFSADKITVRADSWMPYNGDPDGDKPGYGIELLVAIFSPAIDIDYKILPWARAVASTRKGKFDAVIGATAKDAEGFVYPKLPFGVSTNAFYVKQGNAWTYTGTDSLEGKRIGVIQGYGYGPTMDSYIAKHKRDPNRIILLAGDDALERLVKMVLAGRIDAFLENPAVVSRHEKWTAKISNAGEAEDKTALYVAFSPTKESSKKYAAMFDAGLAKLRKSGALKKILDKYNVKDWAK